MKAQNKTTTAILAMITFTLATTGTLAQAGNAWERSRGSTRLAGEVTQNHGVRKMIREVQKALNNWDTVGYEIETGYEARIDQMLDREVSEQLKKIDRMSHDEEAALLEGYHNVVEKLVRSGDVATAEKLEAGRTDRAGFKESMKRMMGRSYQQAAKARMLASINEAGGVKGFLEEESQKLMNLRFGNGMTASGTGGLKGLASGLTVLATLLGIGGVALIIAAAVSGVGALAIPGVAIIGVIILIVVSNE